MQNRNEKPTENQNSAHEISDDDKTPEVQKTQWKQAFSELCNMHILKPIADYARCIRPGRTNQPGSLEKSQQQKKTASPNLYVVDDKSSVLPTRKESTTMATRITVIAKKGGVGKSTIVMALAGHFASNGARVLVVDLDAQATASGNCLTKKTAQELPGDRTVAALFEDECLVEAEDLIHKSHLENIWVLPANDHFSRHLHPDPLNTPAGMQIAIADFLHEVEDRFDWILLDSPPALANLAGWNCLTSAQYVISPVQMEGYSAQTVVGVEEAVAQALSYGNPDLQFLGYVVSEFDKTRKADHAQAEETLRARYGQQVFESVIYRRAKLPQSQNADEHIYTYAPKSSEAKMIDGLANELVSRIQLNRARRAA